MRTRSTSRVVRQFLPIAVPPLLLLGALLAVGELSVLETWMKTADASRLVTTVAACLWLVAAIVVTGCRMRRDTRAHRRLQALREAAQVSGRALVHLQTVVWSSSAGQHAVVVNVASGHRYRLWLPEVHLPIGAFALLERAGNGARVVDLLGAQVIEAAHHYERYARATRAVVAEDPLHRAVPRQHDSVDTLVHEVEEYLKTQGP